MLRLLSALLVRLLYRLSVFGREHVPRSGGVLIVCNRVSLMDRLVLRAACPRGLVIASDRGVDVDAIAAALQRGDAVLLFPEGMLTRSGHILAFGPEVDAILAKADVPVIPAVTNGLWGSVLSCATASSGGSGRADGGVASASCSGGRSCPLPDGERVAALRLRVRGLRMQTPHPQPLSPSGRGESEVPNSGSRSSPCPPTLRSACRITRRSCIARSSATP